MVERALLRSFRLVRESKRAQERPLHPERHPGSPHYMSYKFVRLRWTSYVVSSLWSISALLHSSLLLAQTSTGTFGTILGIVTDETGAVVPRAKGSVINEKTGIKRTVEADEQGLYRVPALLPASIRWS